MVGSQRERSHRFIIILHICDDYRSMICWWQIENRRRCFDLKRKQMRWIRETWEIHTWNRSLTPSALWNKRSAVDLRHWYWIPIGSLEMFDSTFHSLRRKIQDWWQENADEHYERLGAKQGMSLVGPWKVVKQGSSGEMSGWWLLREVGGSNGKQVDNNNSIWSVFREFYTSLMNSGREESSWRYLTVRCDRRFFGHFSFTVITETIIIIFRGWFLVRWNIKMIAIYLCTGFKICPAIVDHRCGLENRIITIVFLTPDGKSPRQFRCLNVRMRRTLPNHRHARSFLVCGWPGSSWISSMSLLSSIDFQSSLLLLNASDEGEGNSSPCSVAGSPALSSVASSKDGSSDEGKSLGRLITSNLRNSSCIVTGSFSFVRLAPTFRLSWVFPTILIEFDFPFDSY